MGASRRKRIWVGDMVPLGYRSLDKKLFLEEAAAAVRRHIGSDAPIDSADFISTHLNRIEVTWTEIAIWLLDEEHGSDDTEENLPLLTVPWGKTAHRRHRSGRCTSRNSWARQYQMLGLAH